MSEFESLYDYEHFVDSVMSGIRFFRDVKQEAFLEAVNQTCHKRKTIIEKGTVVFRAQIGSATYEHNQDGEVFHSCISFDEERMRPWKNKSNEGRLNSKGVPIFYCASHCETAIAEIRPWIGSVVSVAEFSFTRDLKIINYHQDDMGDQHFLKVLNFAWQDQQPAASDKEVTAWHNIDRAFSEPVTPNDTQADYLPTQILAELFQREGFDGIAYKSSVGEGINVGCLTLI